MPQVKYAGTWIRSKPMNEMSVLHGVPNPPPQRPVQMLCDKCQGSWFLKLRVSQLQVHQVLIGEEALQMDPIFFLYECVSYLW